MTLAGDFVKLEVQPTRRTKIVLEKVKPGPLLAQVSGSLSFFYRVTKNSKLVEMTTNPEEARAAFRDACRWAAIV